MANQSDFFEFCVETSCFISMIIILQLVKFKYKTPTQGKISDMQHNYVVKVEELEKKGCKKFQQNQ